MKPPGPSLPVASPLSEGGGAGRQLSPQPPNRAELIGVNDVGGDVLQRRQHGVLPDRPGDAGAEHRAVVPAADRDAVQLVLLRAARVADADRAGQVGGEPGEPGGGVVVGGAGLARRVAADAADRRSSCPW